MAARSSAKLLFRTGLVSHVGKVRPHNEDSALSKPDEGLWVVADGMGGHAAGDVASQLITAELADADGGPELKSRQVAFFAALTRAHDKIQSHARKIDTGTIGATVVALLAEGSEYCCIWSGDSRAYLYRSGQLVQQTKDHTEVQHLLDRGILTPDQASDWPRKNIVTRAIGVSDTPQCDMVEGRLQASDTFLLCSDGLMEHLSDREIAAHLGRLSSECDAQSVCQAMLDDVLARGARDNVTIIVISCDQSV